MSVVRRAVLPRVVGPAAAGPVAAMLLVTGLLGLGGCTSEEDPAPAPAPAPTPSATALADLDGDLEIARADFCSRVAPATVEDVLGAPAEDPQTWSNGDRVAVTGGGRDVVHEYGCSWSAPGGATARAWVFAPPVTAADAGRLVRAAVATKGCRREPIGSGFGSPSVAVACRTGRDTVTAFHGLFGDAWLSCSLTGDAADRSAERWCAAVAEAASA